MRNSEDQAMGKQLEIAFHLFITGKGRALSGKGGGSPDVEKENVRDSKKGWPQLRLNSQYKEKKNGIHQREGCSSKKGGHPSHEKRRGKHPKSLPFYLKKSSLSNENWEGKQMIIKRENVLLHPKHVSSKYCAHPARKELLTRKTGKRGAGTPKKKKSEKDDREDH